MYVKAHQRPCILNLWLDRHKGRTHADWLLYSVRGHNKNIIQRPNGKAPSWDVEYQPPKTLRRRCDNQSFHGAARLGHSPLRTAGPRWFEEMLWAPGVSSRRDNNPHCGGGGEEREEGECHWVWCLSFKKLSKVQLPRALWGQHSSQHHLWMLVWKLFSKKH